MVSQLLAGLTEPRRLPGCGRTGNFLGLMQSLRSGPGGNRPVPFGAPVLPFLNRFWLGGFPYQNRLQEKGHSYSNLSPGGPRKAMLFCYLQWQKDNSGAETWVICLLFSGGDKAIQRLSLLVFLWINIGARLLGPFL